MRKTSVRELHIHTSELVREAADGGIIVIERRGEPVAELRRLYDFYAPLVPYYVDRARNHKIGRYKDFLKRNGHTRTFGPRPPVTRGPKTIGRPPDR